MQIYEERTERILKKAEKEKRRRRNIKIASGTVVALAAVLTLNLVLFVPYQTGGVNVAQYKNSEYYPVISALSKLTYGTAKTTNNFKEWFEDVQYGSEGSAPNEAPTAPNEADAYREVTNNQTEGVIEGDLFKRSDKYVYYLNYRPQCAETVINGSSKEEVVTPAAYVLQAYSIAGNNSELVASYSILSEENTTFDGYKAERELFLSADCSTVTVLSPCYDAQSKTLYTTLVNIDVTDVNDIRETNRVYVSGKYVSSRVKDGDLLLVSNFSVKWNPDFSDEAQFLPQTGALDGLTSLPITDIVLPETATNASYTVVCSLDYATLRVNDCVAFLSYSDEVYVSAENLYVTRAVSEVKTDGIYPATEIYRVAYSQNGLELKGTCEVAGTLNDRFSLDEYEGVLRVFTTSRYTRSVQTASGESVTTYCDNADLYCIDLNAMEIFASVKRFAPDGESVKSARFAGTKAYVCTAEVYIAIDIASDPVYAFDLSDYNRITYTDTGTIPGYALSLITFTGDTLLGIGYGDRLSDLKISVYRENGANVETVAEIQKEDAVFAKEFKAYLIDRENALVGLGMDYYEKDSGDRFTGYRLYRFDGYDFKEVAAVGLFDDAFNDMRAVYIDGYLYLFGHDTFEVLAVA